MSRVSYSKRSLWTPAELVILAELIPLGGLMRAQMHRLPGRTYDAATTHARKIGLRPVTLAGRIRELMSDGKLRTVREIAEHFNVHRKNVSSYFMYACEPGPHQEMHVFCISEGRPTKNYRNGPGPNAERDQKPVHRDPVESLPDEQLTDEQLDARHRRKAGSILSSADLVVYQAMSAMIQAGRASA